MAGRRGLAHMTKDNIDVKISIVMPLYNAERYISEALDSIYHQTFSEFEILLVNDCSEDRTQQILDAYSTKDIRAKCITLHRRHGAGMARNIGMEHAKGKYIIFLDGDDIFHEDMLKKAYEKIVEFDSDLVCFDYTSALSENIYKKVNKKKSRRFVEMFCKQCFKVTDMKLSDFRQINTAAWNKMYRLKYLEYNHLKFQNLPCCNDVFFVQMSFFLAPKIIMLDTEEAMLYFRIHEEKSRIAIHQNPMCGFYAFDAIQKELIERGIFDKYYQYFYTSSFFNLHSLCITTKDDQQREEFDRYIREVAIDKWCTNRSEFDNLLVDFVKLQWENWQKNGMEQISEDVNIQFVIEDFGVQIIDQFLKWKAENRQVAIWGIGKRGRCLLRFLDRNCLYADRLIDSSEKKQGEIINGLVVEAPDEFDMDIIVVTSVGIDKEIEAYIKERSNKDIRIVQLDSIWEENIKCNK